MNLRFRILHYIYHRGAAVQHWFGRRIRPAGAGALLVVSLGCFMSVGQPKNSIFQVFCFSLGMVALSLAWVIFRKAKLTAILELPRHATAGEPLRYSIRLENIGKLTLRGAKLEQTAPDSRPSLREFTSISEPGEDQRNPFDRTMIYYRWQWLMARKASFSASESKEDIELAAGEIRKIPMQLTPGRRGVIPMSDVRALLPDPLGFFQRCRHIDTKPARLVVLPKRYRLPQLIMPGSAAFRIGGVETSNAIGNSGEFVGLRDYLPGDPMRQIHWKSWAHTGKPMVKELEDTFFPTLRTGSRYLRRISGRERFRGNGFHRRVVHRRTGPQRVLIRSDVSSPGRRIPSTAGRGMERTEKLLEVLADVGMEDGEQLDMLSGTVIHHREKMTSCLPHPQRLGRSPRGVRQ